MSFDRFHEDRTLTYLVSLQILAVFFGWGFVTLGVRIAQTGPWEVRESALFFREWGVVLLLIPALWLAFAFSVKRSACRLSEQVVFFSGLAVAVAIFIQLGALGLAARASTLIQVAE